MNNWLMIIKIKISTKLFGKMLWHKILKAKGINAQKHHQTKDFDQVVLDIYQQHFLEIKKDQSLKLEHLSKTYDNGYKAVNDFNLTISPQEFVCLLGPSGCGKTTVLRMLAGFENITNGEYYMGVKSLNDAHPSERNTTMVFQNYALYPFMSVYDNIAFGLKLKTFKNNQFLSLMQQYNAITKPWVNQVKNLKYQIWLLKNPHQNELNNLRKEIKKLSFHKSKSKIIEHDLKVKKLADLLKEVQTLIHKNKPEISKIKANIKQITATMKKTRKTEKQKGVKEKRKITIEIQKLTKAAKKYFKAKKSDYLLVKKELKKQKKLNKRYDQKIYFLIAQELKIIKNLSKNLSSSKADIAKVKTDYQQQIQNIKNEQVEIANQVKILENKKIILKNKNIFLINDLKNTHKPSKKIIDDLKNLAVIWKYSIPARIKNISNIAGIGKYLSRKPTELSGGQRQRVALIRAISKDAQLFLFDEPLSNLDAKLRETMRREIKKIHDSTNATSLYVTHDQVEAMSMASKIVVMNIGFIQQIGKPIDLYDNPANIFVAKFIGTPTINLQKGKLINFDQVMIANTKVTINLNKGQTAGIKSYFNQEIMVGFRPQDVTLITNQEKNAIKGTVSLIELTGSNKIISLDSAIGDNIRITINNSKKIKIGDLVYFKINGQKIHLFDQQNGFCFSSIVNQETKLARKIWINNLKEREVNMMILDKESNKQTLSQKVFKSISAQVMPKTRSKKQIAEIAKHSKVYRDEQFLN